MARTFVRASSQYCEATSSPITSGLCTVVAWYKPSGIANGSAISLGRSAVDADYYALGMDASGLAFFEVSATQSAERHATAGALADGVWAHLAGVQASTTSHTAYLNGVAGTTDTGTSDPDSMDRTTIGGLVYGVGGARVSFAGGDIGECAVWNVALSGAQITALAAGDLPSSIPTGLVGYWKITGTDSPELDSSAGARSLTVSGATAAAGGGPPISGSIPFLILPPAPRPGPSYAAHRAASI